MARKSDYETMSLAEQIRQGLKQSLAHVQGRMTLRSTVLPAAAPAFGSKKIRELREKWGMSQGVFAAYLNVSTKTVQSWEQGTRRPQAGEARLLQLVEAMPDEVREVVNP